MHITIIHTKYPSDTEHQPIGNLEALLCFFHLGDCDHKFVQNPECILCRCLYRILPLAPNSSSADASGGRRDAKRTWICTNRKPPFYNATNEIFACKRKAGHLFLSNAWLPGSGGGWFNMAAAAERSENSGIFWMNGGTLTFIELH